jgi:hypothetical protein
MSNFVFHYLSEIIKTSRNFRLRYLPITAILTRLFNEIYQNIFDSIIILIASGLLAILFDIETIQISVKTYLSDHLIHVVTALLYCCHALDVTRSIETSIEWLTQYNIMVDFCIKCLIKKIFGFVFL